MEAWNPENFNILVAHLAMNFPEVIIDRKSYLIRL